jgi:predicted acetyltransferase
MEISHPSLPIGGLQDDLIELRLIRMLGPEQADQRPEAARFLARDPEYRFAIHRRSDGLRVGRIHLRITSDLTIIRAVGHSGYEVDEAHRRHGYASRALVLIRSLARFHSVAPIWVLIAPDNVASCRTAERAGLTLVDNVEASPEALKMGCEPRLCRYKIEQP